MPDDLYNRDILAWSQRQAELLRRLAAGERVNDLDWPHVIEEVEDVGRSELNACQSLLGRALDHLLKLYYWPEHPSAMHWRREARVFLRDAARAFSPSMRQAIDLDALYRTAARDVLADPYDDKPVAAAVPACPITLDALLAAADDVLAVVRRFAPAVGDGG